MFLDLLGEFRNVKLGAFFVGKMGTIIEIVEQMLVRIRASRRIF